MRLNTLLSLLALTFLSCMILLNAGVASGQVYGRGPVGPTVRTGPAGPPSVGSSPSLGGSSGTLDARGSAPELNRSGVAVAPQPSGAAATSGTPPFGEAASSVDGGGCSSSPSPTPDITPTSTPQLATPTPTQNSGSASNANSSPSQTPEQSLTPVASTYDPDYGSWWKWLLGGVFVILIALGISSSRRNGRY